MSRYTLCSAPIKWVHVLLDRGASEPGSIPSQPHPLVSLSLNESQSVPVRCVSDGGHPAPELKLTVGDRDITSQFETIHATEVRGPRGLRAVHFRSSCWTTSFTVTAEDHGKSLRCHAKIDDVGSVSSNVSLLVNCEYYNYTVILILNITKMSARGFSLIMYWGLN